MAEKDNLKLYNAVRTVPEEAQKPIKGGRLAGMTDINPMWRIKALTEQFGPCGIGWYYTTDKQWLEAYGDEVVAFVNISLYIKNGDEWSAPICGSGGSKFVAREKSGPYVSDEAYKMATTDAISVACKQLGMAADIYFAKDRTKYSDSDRQATEEDIKFQKSMDNHLTEKISANDVKIIEKMVEGKDALKTWVLQQCNVTKFEDMTNSQYGQAMRALNEHFEKKGK